MLFRGTTSRSKTDIAESIDGIGAVQSNTTGREISNFTLQVFKNDVNKAVRILGDALSNSVLNENELEVVKQEVSDEHEEGYHRYFETTIENAHFNVYRDHMMGQPIKGDRDIVHTLKADHLREFHSTNYFGDNIVVVGAGNINHDEFVAQVNQHFASLPKQTSSKIKNKEKSVFNPALLFIRDDEMVNSNVAVFYDAPSVKDPDYYSFLLL
jgi:mitochondrial-processing peptidase subunit beta